jgi:hypothetical protein
MTRSTIRAEIDLRRERLDQLRGERDKLSHDIQIEEAELRGLELAAELLGAGETTAIMKSVTFPTRPSSGGKGRQVGAISKQWRDILGLMLHRHRDGADPRQIAALGSEAGLRKLEARSVTPRMQKYITQGYITEIDGKYVVSAAAKERFQLYKLSELTNNADSVEEIEEPSASTPSSYNLTGAA